MHHIDKYLVDVTKIMYAICRWIDKRKKSKNHQKLLTYYVNLIFALYFLQNNGMDVPSIYENHLIEYCFPLNTIFCVTLYWLSRAIGSRFTTTFT